MTACAHMNNMCRGKVAFLMTPVLASVMCSVPSIAVDAFKFSLRLTHSRLLEFVNHGVANIQPCDDAMRALLVLLASMNLHRTIFWRLRSDPSQSEAAPGRSSLLIAISNKLAPA